LLAHSKSREAMATRAELELGGIWLQTSKRTARMAEMVRLSNLFITRFQTIFSKDILSARN
jgi:hypothetical protein